MRFHRFRHVFCISVALLGLSLHILCLAVADTTGDLPPGIIRGPLLHEHSFQPPLVDDWWEEGVPHFMIGGSAIANERFLRLTSNNLNDFGFAFNTAPLDHENWEARVKFSIRPPPPAAEIARRNKSSTHYQGGEGLAFWYLSQPIGDDHQHVVKYSKSLSPEVMNEMKDMENPWRIADQLLNTEDDDEEDGDTTDEDDLTEKEKEERKKSRETRELKRIKREELFRRLFKRGTSIDDTENEPRIFGVKYSDFTKGFGVLLDSVGDEAEHLDSHMRKGDSIAHHHHKPSISLLLNLPNHTLDAGSTVVNNFNPTTANFRHLPKLLRCEFDFRHDAYKMYTMRSDSGLKEERMRALEAREEPAELIVRYHNKKLSILIKREDIKKRRLLDENEAKEALRKHGVDITSVGAGASTVEVRRTFTETLCGEVYPIEIPLKYHFGLSASTGHLNRKQRKMSEASPLIEPHDSAVMHVDVHDVFNFELRELGKDAKAMGYSKSIPLEHFDYEADKREREHFSRQIPVEPDADTA